MAKQYRFEAATPCTVTGFFRQLNPGEIINDPSEVALIEKLPPNAVKAMFVLDEKERKPKKEVSSTPLEG